MRRAAVEESGRVFQDHRTPPVVPLHELGPEAVPPFGGKVCGLARLHRTGAAVPEGFAVAAASLGPHY